MQDSLSLPLPPLRRRILRSFLTILALYGLLGTFIMIAVYFASGMTPQLIHRNYDSIAAAIHMREAWEALRDPQDSLHDVSHWVAQFERSLRFEEGNITETGEGDLAAKIRALWEEVKQKPAALSQPAALSNYSAMQADLSRLIALNEAAMFRLSETSTALRRNVIFGAAGLFFLTLVVALYLADGLASRVASPIKEMAEALRNKPMPGDRLRLPTPTTLELRILTHEMNQLWKRLSELRKLNLEEMADQRTKLQIILESVEDAILVLDQFGNVIQCNQGLAELLALPCESVIGHKWTDLPTSHDNYLVLREALVPTMDPKRTIELRVDTHEKVFSGRCRPVVSAAGETVGNVYLMHDITSRKQMDKLKSEFIAVLSHELKTPLQSLGTAADLLMKRRKSMDEESAMLVETLQEGVERLRAVATDFVQVSFVDPHSLKLKLARHALSDLIQEWVKPLKVVARDRQVQLDLVREGGGVIWANIDAVKFPWAISNLLSNAIRFSPPESKVTVWIADLSGGGKPEIDIEIRDEGPGIPEEMRKKMFDPYFQAPNQDSKIPSGFLGLGLTIAKEVVEAHGGKIEYSPGNPTGSIFRIRLPQAALG